MELKEVSYTVSYIWKNILFAGRRNEKEKGTKMKDEKYETIYENLNTKDRLK